MKINMIKLNGVLHPFDAQAEEVIKKWKTDDFITVEAKRPRNGQFHRKFFAMLNIVYQNTDEFKSIDDLLNYIKIMTGWNTIVEANNVAFRVSYSSFYLAYCSSTCGYSTSCCTCCH